LVMEVLLTATRTASFEMEQVDKRIFYCYVPYRFCSLYSRFLVAAISDETLMLISSFIIGVTELVLRTTALQRDMLARKMLAKVTGEKIDQLELSIEKTFKAQLIILETIFEVADIISMSVFAIVCCHKEGPLSALSVPPIPLVVADTLGFKFEDVVLKNMAIQLALEFAVDILAFTIEELTGTSIQMPMWINNPFALSQLTIISMLYPLYFVTSLIVFPVFDWTTKFYSTHEIDKFAKANSMREKGFDVPNTWISYIPKTVYFAYFQKFLKEKNS